MAGSHKYWFLAHPDKLDDYHSPRYQRFHFLKILQIRLIKWAYSTPVRQGSFCAGRFVDGRAAL